MSLLKCAEALGKIIDTSAAKVSILHSSTRQQTVQLSEYLLMNDISGARSWWTALERLSAGETIFLIVDHVLSDELSEIVEQLVNNQPEIEVFDRKLSEPIKIRLLHNRGKLLLVGPKTLLPDLQAVTIEPEEFLVPFDK